MCFSVSDMVSEEPKRDIADFFRPYANPTLSKSIPTKRPSPTPSHEVQSRTISPNKEQKRTPVTPSRVKDAICLKSPLGPRSGASVTIPIRSPKPSPQQNPRGRFTTNSPVLQSRALFPSASKDKDRGRVSLFFADIPASGQSIVKDGKVVAVRSSDDEDSDSLCSLEDILGRNRNDAPSRSSSPPDVDEDLEAQRVKILDIFSNGRSNALVGREKLRELTSKANGLNFDISLLVGDHFDDEEIEANIAKAKQGYKAVDNQERLQQQGLLDTTLLASLVSQDDGSDNLQRLFNAVERTDALATDCTWSMFHSKSLSANPLPGQPVLEDAVGLDSWLICPDDATLRSRAYLSGYVAEKAAEGTVPDDLLTRIFNSIISEPREDLRKSYMRIVNAGSYRWTHRNLTPGLVEQTFVRLGADSTMVNCESDIRPELQALGEDNATRNIRLLSAIETLTSVSTDMNAEALSKFVNLTMRLAIDTHLMSDSHLCSEVEDAVSALLGHSEERVSISVAQCILDDIGLRVKDPFLQAQALRHLLPTSPVAASLRIQLARLFLTGVAKEDALLFDPSDPGISLPQLTLHLQDRRYDISRSSRQGLAFDYSTLSSLVFIFDAALANGGRPQTFSDVCREREFNDNVDMLAERIKFIITSIADTGASHMRRTEAKEALNALHFRLLYGVRTKPRPKKSVFGGRDGAQHRAEERSAGMMQQFLERRNVQKALRERDANVAVERDTGSLSQKSDSEELIRKQLGLAT